MLRAAAAAACLLALGACGEKLPKAYQALGIPPAPELVESITRHKAAAGDGDLYEIQYKPGASWTGRPMMNLLESVRSAGYVVDEKASTSTKIYFDGPSGPFRIDVNAEGNKMFLRPGAAPPSQKQ